MNENIDLTKILKDCPKGWKFYSSIYGELRYSSMYISSSASKIYFEYQNYKSLSGKSIVIVEYYRDGRISSCKGECTLFPSKYQRDWSKFSAPWYNPKKQDEDKKEINNFDVLPGLYKCVHRMFDGTPNGRLLFEIGNVYKCLSKHDRAEFEVSYGHSVYLEDPVVCKYFIPFESKVEQATSQTNEQKSADKIEPRFKVGDWVVRGDTIAQILDIQEQYYVGLDINGKDFVSSIFLNSDKIHLWTIQDAKDGNVLCCKSGWMCIFKSLNNHTNTFSSYCFMDSYKYFFNSGSECHTLDKEFINAYNGEIHPATKEQHDTFMKAMNDAGYEWDAEKKKLKKLVTNRFDPNTLQPFDKVLVKDFDETSYWTCNLFSYYNKNKGFYYCSSVPFDVCIPYNDNTKHLVGTTDEAPEFYRYWED